MTKESIKKYIRGIFNEIRESSVRLMECRLREVAELSKREVRASNAEIHVGAKRWI